MKKYSCFRNGRDEREAKCFVCKAGRCVSVENKGALNVECENKKAVRGETSSAKVTFFLLPRETNQVMLY